ncbi:hypothetical protein GCM10017624_12970 [Azotobacter vinelandii]|nr:hypothetical protein GCM10017624_12970 [Azotobacter vinelandii]
MAGGRAAQAEVRELAGEGASACEPAPFRRSAGSGAGRVRIRSIALQLLAQAGQLAVQFGGVGFEQVLDGGGAFRIG